MSVLRLRMKNYIQPFERRLALQEVRTLAGAEPRMIGAAAAGVEYEVTTSQLSNHSLASQLAFWEAVEGAGVKAITKQSLREATVYPARNGVPIGEMGLCLPFKGNIQLPSRRCLRYGPHGIHEYRGKFFPQLVRALINISGIGKSGVVADPMSGSGTTVVEGLLSGRRSLGLDLNPLSVFLGQTKCRLLGADPQRIADSYERVRRVLSRPTAWGRKSLPYFSQLPEVDQTYLQAWFSCDVLQNLDEIGRVVHDVSDPIAKDLMRVSLSNILRRVSWQKDDDLRVRKEIRSNDAIDARKEFMVELERSVRSVLAFLHQNGDVALNFDIREADARECSSVFGRNSIDAVITSPPYATALPYLDTDRLSLCYLGLLPRDQHRAKDLDMIGNREVTEKARQRYWRTFETSGEVLPKPVQAVIQQIHDLNSRASVGFRRRNLASLLAKYFFDMRDVLTGIHEALKPGSFAFVVVGNNHTIAGGQRVEIQTAKHLRDIAQTIGFQAGESMQMEMLISRDIFRQNAMRSEEILALYKKH